MQCYRQDYERVVGKLNKTVRAFQKLKADKESCLQNLRNVISDLAYQLGTERIKREEMRRQRDKYKQLWAAECEKQRKKGGEVKWESIQNM